MSVYQHNIYPLTLTEAIKGDPLVCLSYTSTLPSIHQSTISYYLDYSIDIMQTMTNVLKQKKLTSWDGPLIVSEGYTWSWDKDVMEQVKHPRYTLFFLPPLLFLLRSLLLLPTPTYPLSPTTSRQQSFYFVLPLSLPTNSHDPPPTLHSFQLKQVKTPPLPQVVISNHHFAHRFVTYLSEPPL